MTEPGYRSTWRLSLSGYLFRLVFWLYFQIRGVLRLEDCGKPFDSLQGLAFAWIIASVSSCAAACFMFGAFTGHTQFQDNDGFLKLRYRVKGLTDKSLLITYRNEAERKGPWQGGRVKIAAGVVETTSRTILARQRRHRTLQPAAIDRVLE